MIILSEFSDSYCQQDAGRMLLEHPTLDFNGATLVLTEEERPVPMAAKGRGQGVEDVVRLALLPLGHVKGAG